MGRVTSWYRPLTGGYSERYRCCGRTKWLGGLSGGRERRSDTGFTCIKNVRAFTFYHMFPLLTCVIHAGGSLPYPSSSIGTWAVRAARRRGGPHTSGSAQLVEQFLVLNILASRSSGGGCGRAGLEQGGGLARPGRHGTSSSASRRNRVVGPSRHVTSRHVAERKQPPSARYLASTATRQSCTLHHAAT
jgi:hypothetical protein